MIFITCLGDSHGEGRVRTDIKHCYTLEEAVALCVEDGWRVTDAGAILCPECVASHRMDVLIKSWGGPDFAVGDLCMVRARLNKYDVIGQFPNYIYRWDLVEILRKMSDGRWLVMHERGGAIIPESKLIKIGVV